jgi:hypothetical protein
MSQHDFNIANQGFPATRADLNNALAALASSSSGTSEPSTTYAGQMWNDTTNNLLKFRNDANDAWITFAKLDQATNEWEVRSSVFQAVDSAGIAFKTDEGTTRATLGDDGNFQFNSVDINGGTIDGTIIGGTTPAAITGTDLTLSGGVYLGGTGSANKLEDYEEGSWTPTCAQASISIVSARYTKIGDIVHLIAYLSVSSGTNTDMIIGGIPFSVPSNGWAPSIVNKSGSSSIVAMVRANATSGITLDVKDPDDVAVKADQVGTFFIFSLTYRTT